MPPRHRSIRPLELPGATRSEDAALPAPAGSLISETREAGFVGLLGRASARVEHALNSELVDIGLTYLQFRVLGAVVSGKANSPGECAKVLTLTPSNVTRAIDRLAAMQLVHRTRARSDRRAISLQATSRAVELIAATQQRVTQALARIFSTFSPDQLERLASELHRLAHPARSNDFRFLDAPGAQRSW